MTREQLIERVVLDPQICGGKPCVRGTRIPVAVILDGLAEGLTPQDLIDHYPQLTEDDIHAALAYGAELANENVWRATTVG
jgi:uncharacterized protein (DUF433 family)